jgi:hypothetical protein
MKKNIIEAVTCALLLTLSACGRKGDGTAEQTSTTKKPDQSQSASVAQSLPSFDFSNPADCAGWEPTHDISSLTPAMNGLVIAISGGDPHMAGPPRVYPAGQPLWLHVRLKSDQAGTAQMFYYDSWPTPGNSVRFNVSGDGWQEAKVPMPALGAGWRLRFDPPGTSGTCTLARIWFEERATGDSSGQSATPSAPATPEQQAAKLKGKWTKAFEDARRDFQNSNDRESAEFAGKILESLDQPGGMSPAALAANAERIKKQARELVRRGVLESAASLNWALWQVLYRPGPGVQPANPNHKTGGTPGPGGLVLYLPFDAPDKSGVIRDASGAGNDGRVYGATWVAEGKFGGAYHFSITNLTDRIVIPNSDLLNPDYVTVSAWIKTSDTDGFWNRIVDKDFRNAYCLALGGDYNGKADRGRLDFESSRGAIKTGRALNDNQWHHVAAVYDGKVVQCYLDGTGPGRPVRNPGPLKKSTWDLCIGNSVVDYETGEFIAYDGLIDEVRIYNRALSAAEIKALATGTQAGVDAATPPADNSAKPPAAERLKQVKQLFDQGLINKEDYDKKVKEIVDSI